MAGPLGARFLDGPPIRPGKAASRLLSRVVSLLPRGGTLPAKGWSARHRVLVGVLWLHALGLPAFALGTGHGLAHSLAEGLPAALFAALASYARIAPRWRAALVAAGLLTCSAVLVHLSHGHIEAHFHFFVVVSAIALYEDWLPFLLALGYVVLHHGIAGTVAAGEVFNHADGIANPWKWAAIHGVFILGSAAVGVTAWRFNEVLRAEAQAAHLALADREERLRCAIEAGLDAFVAMAAVPGSDGELRDFRIIELNRPAEDLLGVAHVDVVGRGWREAMPEHAVGPLEDDLALVLETGTAYEDETETRGGAAGSRWLARQVVPFGDDALAVTLRDISARKRGEQEREAQRVQLEAQNRELEDQRAELERQTVELTEKRRALEGALGALGDEKGRIEAFYRFAQRLVAESDLAPLAATILDGVADFVGAKEGALYGPDDDGRLGLIAVYGPSQAPLHLADEPPLDAHQTMTIGGGERDGDGTTAHGLRLLLRHGGLLQGVIVLSRPEDSFVPLALRGVQHLADQAAVALSNCASRAAAQRQAAVNEAVLETAHDAYVAMDAEGRVTAWNEQAQMTFGWRRDEALGRPLDQMIIPPAGREAHRASLARHLPGDESRAAGRPQEITAVRRSGEEFPAEITISALPAGYRNAFHAFVRDVSERRRAELYRTVQHDVTRVLADAATLEEARLGVLAAMGRLLGWQAASLWRVDRRDGRIRCTEAWSAEAASEGFTGATGQLTLAAGEGLPGLVWSSGEPVWLDELADEFPATRVPLARKAGLGAGVGLPLLVQGQVSGVLEFFTGEPARRDPALLEAMRAISHQLGQFFHRKHAERAAERLKERFIGLVSHELRTPLTSIMGYQELLLEGGVGELTETQERFLRIANRNAARLLRLVGDLLFSARLEGGGLEIQTREVELASLAGDAIEAARPAADHKGIELGLECGSLPPLLADPGRLGQALDNLISNALKFTPAGGRVEVRLAREGESAVIEVEDTGEGVPVEEQDRLFERFYRASNTNARQIPGVGLGLSITKAIVEAHGGGIGLQSEEGAGTTFRITLPIAPGNPVGVALAQPAAP